MPWWPGGPYALHDSLSVIACRESLHSQANAGITKLLAAEHEATEVVKAAKEGALGHASLPLRLLAGELVFARSEEQTS